MCWGNYEGPHVDDVELADVLPRLYRANVGAISLPTANPRHEHDWRAFQQHPLPDDKLLIIGTIDVTTNFVEHPQVVADRICRFADVVGKHRLIASTDCGFGTSAGQVNVAEDVVWAKLASLTAGAELATPAAVLGRSLAGLGRRRLDVGERLRRNRLGSGRVRATLRSQPAAGSRSRRRPRR